MLRVIFLILLICTVVPSFSQSQQVKVQQGEGKSIEVIIGDKLFTPFFVSRYLEKPVLYPLTAANGTVVTRGFPLQAKAGEPTDHPHHLGMWFNFENVNGLDFWNNSFAITADKKHLYGWVKTDKIVNTTSGKKGSLTYHANWTDKNNQVLLQETTTFTFSGNSHQRIVDRTTVLKADTLVTFNDAKDGMLGLSASTRIANTYSRRYKVYRRQGDSDRCKGQADTIANGNYLTSEGKSMATMPGAHGECGAKCTEK